MQQIEYLGKTGEAVAIFPFGLHASATVDSFALLFSVQGQPENRAAILMSGNRPTLEPGEVALYNPTTGATIKMKTNGSIELTATNIKIDGNVEITGNLTVGPLAKDFLLHAHSITSGSSSPGPTGPVL